MLDYFGWKNLRKMLVSIGLLLGCWILFLRMNDATFNKAAITLALAGFFSVNLAINRAPIKREGRSSKELFFVSAYLVAISSFFAVFFFRAL